MPRIDLHIHSTASDGTVAPAGIVAAAKKAKLAAVALTDHDTVAGLAEFMAAGAELGVETIPGLELAVDHPRVGALDIIGLWVPQDAPKLLAVLDEMAASRRARNRIIVGRLANMGVGITVEEVETLAGHGTAGRPHIAQVLVAKGYVRTVQQAFDRYLRDHGPAYADKKTLPPDEALGLLREVGATTILAHPGSYPKIPRTGIEELLVELKSLGLDGLEVYYPDYGPELTRSLLVLAERHELAVSGGSDFHGAVKPDIRLGTGKGVGFAVPSLVLDKLKALREKQGLPV